MRADTVGIQDYAAPWMPAPIRVFNATCRRPACAWIRLEPASLLKAAQRRVGLVDFGNRSFLEPLAVLVDALEREAHLSAFGRLATRGLLVQLLSTRLLVEDLIRRNPRILNTPVESPIVIAGLPRSGTTHLHNLMGEDPELRSLPYWESLEPVLPASRRNDPGKADPRVARCAQALKLVNWIMPLFKAMHEMTPEHVHEEIQLLAVDFQSMLFESSYYVPSYADWYKSHDQTSAYRYLRLLLQVLQHERGGVRRWVLKSPQHLEQLGPLFAVFPDARIVRTHRDPVRVTASTCTMITYAARMNAGAVDAHKVGGYWSQRVEQMLRRFVDDSPNTPEDQAFDVRFHEFMPDNLSMVERIYEFAGCKLTDPARHAMRAYLDTHPPGRHGRIDYRLEPFGVDPQERRRALRFYQDYFDVPDEL